MNIFRWETFPNLTAVTTNRLYGFSNEPYKSNNLAFHVGDEHTLVFKNRTAMFEKLNIKPTDLILTNQSHSDKIVKVTEADGGRGYADFHDGIVADALYTNVKGLALGVYHADCVPVFVYVPSHDIVGIIHAGEQGSVANITGKFIDLLIENEHVKPEEIFAMIGPSLSFSHRLITKERALELAKIDSLTAKAVKGTHPAYFLDLPLLNLLQLRAKNIPLKNIEISEICTYEQNDLYFSYAKESQTGRNLSIIRRD